MRAVTIVDGRLEWRAHADPVAGTGELLVDVRAAGLNGADVLQRRGGYPAPPGAPADLPGLEVAGVVRAVGPGVRRFAPGDRVMALVAGGGQAELAVVHERVAMSVPDGLSWAEAGGFPEVFVTAHDALFTQCELVTGERVVVHGAAGGVGIAAVQLALAAGADVVATVRAVGLHAAVHDLARPAGGGRLDVVEPDRFVDHGPFDVVLELVGAPNLPADLDSLADRGRISVIALAAGRRVELDLSRLVTRRGRIHGTQLRSRSLEDKALATRAVERSVLPLLRTGRVRVPVFAQHPMPEAEAAYEQFVAGGKLGKIVLVRD